jgi:uncharacterized protein YggE
VIADDGAAATVLLSVDRHGTFGLAQRCEVVEFDLGAFDGESLRLQRPSLAIGIYDTIYEEAEMKRLVVVLAMAAAVPVVAQVTTATRFVRSVGEGTSSGKPDRATIGFAVVTQATTAQDAAAQNADKTAAVLNALKQVLGANADIRTINYSLYATYSSTGMTITGFTASNTVLATVDDINIPGKLIDAAISAGANRVDSLQFSIKDDLPLRREALRLAAQQARQRADAIALGAGVRLGNVLDVQEGYFATPVRSIGDSLAPTTTTPIVAGTIDVRATVTLDIEIVQ